jgi:hypothetical protein
MAALFSLVPSRSRRSIGAVSALDLPRDHLLDASAEEVANHSELTGALCATRFGPR